MAVRDSPRIALMTDGVMPYIVGGIQRHSRRLCEHLLRLGCQVTLYHTARDDRSANEARRLDDWEPALRERLRIEFVPWPTGIWYPGHYLSDYTRYSAALLSAFLGRDERDRIDFVYAQGLTGLAFTAARRRGVPLPPIGVNAHGYEVFQRCVGFRARLGQLLLRNAHRQVSLEADLVFSFSGRIKSIVQDVIGVDPERIRVLPNAVDPLWMADTIRPSKSPRRFVFVGRFERRKGVQELSAVLRDLDGLDWSMDFVGPIPLRCQIRDSRIRYCGELRTESDLMRIYDGCDCIIVPSYAEGMPTVLIEAMARGLTPVATDVGAVEELVSAAGGILLESPSPSHIRPAMKSVIDMSDDELNRRKLLARNAARSYGWDIVASRTLAAITEYLSRGPKRTRWT